jgi:virginiamycin B lyase
LAASHDREGQVPSAFGSDISEIPVSDHGSGPYHIIGPDQAIWLTLIHSGQVARLSLGGDLDSHQASPSSGRPSTITTGPDGALWFTLNQADAIGRITTSGDVPAFPVTAGGGPFGITHGPDGALWYTQIGADRIGRITTTGQVTDFPLPAAGSMPSMITLGGYGVLWFTLNQAGSQLHQPDHTRRASRGIRPSYAVIRATWPDQRD